MAKDKRSINKKRITILLSIGFVLLIVGLIMKLVWILAFEKNYIFKGLEEKLMNAGEKFYEINKQQLPKNGETVSITYQMLLDKEYVESLYVPKTNRTCDLENSWVRVHNNNGKYEYYRYLKCEKFESNTDHTGPVIKLNGDDSMIIDLGGTYEEPGVKSVDDDVDGKIDIKNVVIKGNVDTSKIGTYRITYTVSDRLLNYTSVTRKVIVRRKLKDAVIARTDESNIFKGAYIANNFVLYSGMLWRIVGLNSDSSIKLVLADNIANVNYAKDDVDFNKSNIQKWLNEYFYKYLIDPDKYLVKNSTFCISAYNNPNGGYEECSKYSDSMAVGLLSLQDIKRTELVDNAGNILSFLDSTYYYLLSNLNANGKALIKAKANYTIDFEKNSLLPIRPVINLKADINIVSGIGTDDMPFRLGDYTTGKEHSKLSDRITGEIVNYSGVNWVVVDHDKDGNTKMVMTSNLLINGIANVKAVSYNTKNKVKAYNPKEDGNIAEEINNNWTVYIKDDLVVNHEFSVPTYQVGQKYTDGKVTKIKTKFAIPNTYELFSASQGGVANGKYYLMNVASSDNEVLFINNVNGLSFQYNYLDFRDIGAKLVVYISKDAVISSGNGILTDPYRIK